MALSAILRLKILLEFDGWARFQRDNKHVIFVLILIVSDTNRALETFNLALKYMYIGGWWVLPDYVHGLVDDFWLVYCYDLLGSRSGSEHGQYASPTAHI